MSQNTAPQLPDVNTAYDVILHGVHKRAFLGRLAELGHVPQTEKEADALVELGFKIAAAEQNPLLNKQAATAEQPGPYTFATQALDSFLGTGKQAASPETAGLDNVSIAGAMELARDPTIFASAFVLKQAQDAMLLQQTQAMTPIE